MHSGRKIILTPYESEGQQNKVFLIVVDSLLVHARVIDFRQKRLPYNDCCNLHAATDTRAFYFTKYRQDCGLTLTAWPPCTLFIADKYWFVLSLTYDLVPRAI